MFEIKGDNDKFESLEEFIDNLERGGEIEFVYKNKEYSITQGDHLFFIEVGNALSEKEFKNINELLEQKIDGNKIIDIVTIIEPYFRCF